MENPNVTKEATTSASTLHFEYGRNPDIYLNKYKKLKFVSFLRKTAF